MKAIEVISIPVSDQNRAKEFYIKLGFEVLVDIPMGNGQSWVQLGLPYQDTTISLVSQWPYKEVEMSAGSLHGIILETDDIEKEVRELKKKGVEVGIIGPGGYEAGKISETPWGKFTHITDPDGNGLNLHQNKVSTEDY
jgi:catechol 2,3-dioxygenase-like lactoylglutathione lyase family enzyme